MVDKIQQLLLASGWLENLNPFSGIGQMLENFKLDFQTSIAGYSLGICVIVGTVALFLQIMGFNTGKWALLAGATLIFILIII